MLGLSASGHSARKSSPNCLAVAAGHASAPADEVKKVRPSDIFGTLLRALGAVGGGGYSVAVVHCYSNGSTNSRL